MSSFVQSAKVNGGTFDLQLSKVTIACKSSASAKDFF